MNSIYIGGMNGNTNQMLQALEVKRQAAHSKAKKVFPKAFRKTGMGFFIVIGGIMTAVLLFGNPDKVGPGPHWPMYVGALIASVFMGAFLGGIYTLLRRGKISDNFWREAKKDILNALQGEIKYDYEYDPTGISITEFARSEIYRGNSFNSKDKIKIRLGEQELIFAECHSQISSHKASDNQHTFYGFFVTISMDMKGIEGPIKIVPTFKFKEYITMFGAPSTTKKSNDHLEKVQIESIDSWGKYEVYAPKNNDVNPLFTVEFVDQLKAIHQLFDKGVLNVNFSVNEGYLHISTLTLKDLFRANLFLKKSLLNSSIVKDFKADLKYVEQISDILLSSDI